MGESALSALLGELLRVLGASTPQGGAASDGEKLARILNNVCIRVMEHSQRTALLW